MARFVARLISIFVAVITSFVTTLRSRARAVIGSPASPWSTSSARRRVPCNPGRIEDAPVSELSSWLIAIRGQPRGSDRGQRVRPRPEPLERRRPPRRSRGSSWRLGSCRERQARPGLSRLDLLIGKGNGNREQRHRKLEDASSSCGPSLKMPTPSHFERHQRRHRPCTSRHGAQRRGFALQRRLPGHVDGARVTHVS